MKIEIVGGGPSGLCFASLMKQRDPSRQITVYERNRPDDTFGWGIVFSDRTLENLAAADPVIAERIVEEFIHWDDIVIHFKGTVTSTTGHGFVGLGRLRFLQLLQEHAEGLGVEIRYETEIDSIAEMRARADLVIAADGIDSGIRQHYATEFKPDIDLRKNKFIWLGTHKLFDAFAFIFVETEHGFVQAHAYRHDASTSTFIVECTEKTWRALGGEDLSSGDSIELCERLFANYLDGHGLMSNAQHRRGREWITFPRINNARWHHENVVLLGDAAHTAHFTIGSGTKLGFEDAIELTEQIHTHADLGDALEAYEERRRVGADRVQTPAQHSMEWFESVERHAGLEPMQFCYSLLTRSQRVSHENLRLRDPKWIQDYEQWFASRAKRPNGLLPMQTPFELRSLELKNRLVERLARYELASVGDAGLVMVEMTADHDEAQCKRFVDLVHESTAASIGLRITDLGPTPEIVRVAEMAEMIGFDLLELPVGGDTQFGLAVFRAVRAVWPKRKPISVQIPTADGVDGVALSEALKEYGSDIINVSAGKPSHSERIRNEASIATIATANRGGMDQGNTIIAAGRADLCFVNEPTQESI